MNDLFNVGILFLVFAAALGIYGAVLHSTGDANLMPYRTRHTIRGPEDVRRVGRIVALIGVIIGIISLILIIVNR